MRPERAPFRPLCFPTCEQVPRVIVYGDLFSRLPEFDATPPIERFLYGPNRVGKTPLRNPQGMALLGPLLLVCDQGQPDIVAINVVTGRCDRWCDAEHRPRCPVDIVIDRQRVFVADTTERAVLLFDPAGQFLGRLAPPDGAEDGFRPTALAIHESILYIGNTGGACIERYDLNNQRWLEPMTPPAARGYRPAPTGLAVDSNGVLLIADSLGATLWRVTREGRWLSNVGRAGRGPGQFVRPKQVCTAASGLILVSDAGRQSILVFKEDGTFLTEIHEQRDRWDGWTMPAGLVTVTPHDPVVWNFCAERAGDTPAETYVIVSDVLGGRSLSVLGIVGHETNRTTDSAGAP